MNIITLRNKTVDGKLLTATFLPEAGMNLSSFKTAGCEVIDQSTKVLFDERFAGLGALIGPHFHRRKAESLPCIKDESLFPHIARVKSKGVQDPFSHGIARYAPWKAEHSETKITAELTGKDLWQGVSLADLEGQNFKMNYSAELLPSGLSIQISIVSDTDSLVGLHYYYRLPGGKGKVSGRVQDIAIGGGMPTPVQTLMPYSPQQEIAYDCKKAVDATFFPFPDPLGGAIHLDTDEYNLKINYTCTSQENSWQLYHPENASYICIEPLSAQDPRHPILSVSALHVHLCIEPKGISHER